MIESITAQSFSAFYSSAYAKMTFKLNSPDSSYGIAVTNVDGLGPVRATINSGDYWGTHKSFYKKSRLESRNIVITFRLIGTSSYSVEDCRQMLCKLFYIQSQVWLTIVTTNRTSYIRGYVESVEPVIFSSGETVQVSIICPSPYFWDNQDQAYSSLNNTTTGSVYLYFYPGVASSNYYGDYSSEVTSGVVITLHDFTNSAFVSSTSTVTIYSEVRHYTGSTSYTAYRTGAISIDRSQILTLLGISSASSGDFASGGDYEGSIVISSIDGDKYAKFIYASDNSEVNIMPAIEVDEDYGWPKLIPGYNRIFFPSTLSYKTVEFPTLYLGV